MKLVNKIKFERCVNIIREHLEVNDNILFSNTRSMDGVDARHTLYKLCSQSSIRNNVISKHMEEKGIKVSDSNISASIKRINKLISDHKEAPHERKLQRALAEDVTTRVHSKEDYENAVKASEILFKKGQEAVDGLKSLSANLIQDIFEGVPQASFTKADLANGIDIVSALAEKGGFLKSNGEARRELKQNSISVNKAKVTDTKVLTEEDLIGGKYILLQKGKKNNFLVTVE